MVINPEPHLRPTALMGPLSGPPTSPSYPEGCRTIHRGQSVHVVAKGLKVSYCCVNCQLLCHLILSTFPSSRLFSSGVLVCFRP